MREKVMPSRRRSPACVSCPSGAFLSAGPVKTPVSDPVAPIALQTPYGDMANSSCSCKSFKVPMSLGGHVQPSVLVSPLKFQCPWAGHYIRRYIT